MAKKTILYLVRHGESWGNKSFNQGVPLEKPALGSDLTEEGMTQALALADLFTSNSIDAIYSSHLLRAKHTAELIAQKLGLTVNENPQFQERMTGNLGGKTKLELMKQTPFIFGDPDVLSEEDMFNWKLFDDMETAREVVTRFVSALTQITTKHQGEHTIIVTHGNLLRSFLVHLGVGSFKNLGHGSVANAACITIELENSQFRVKHMKGVYLS